VNFPKIDKELVKTGLFEYLDFALQFAPATPAEMEIRAKLARIGIGPGKHSTSRTTPPSILPPGEGTWKLPGVVKVK